MSSNFATPGGDVATTNASNDTTSNLPTRQDRDRAVQEARQCMDACQGFQLDGFNLLGVVANPRSGSMIGSTSAAAAAAMDSSSSTSRPSSPSRASHSQQQQQQQPSSTQQQQQHVPSESAAAATAAAAAAAVESEESGMFSDAVHTLEYTLAQVTEQIETLNLFLEELSRQYLGDDTGESLFLEYYYQEEEDGTLLTDPQNNLPPQLANIRIQDLQAYLEECGVLAHSLFAQGLTTRTLDHDVVSKDELEQQLQEIPPEFYDADFDLTDSQTFVELLLQSPMNGEDGDTTAAASSTQTSEPAGEKTKKKKKSSKQKAANALYQTTQELVPVREPDSLAGHLDRVEIALQDQVRQKSTAFFQETTRFRQLQASIEDLLQQVQSLRTTMQQAIGVYRQTSDISNHQRQDYELLIDLLDASMELVRCKASIGGLLSANDYLGAAQQIQYGRKLLQGVDRDENGSATEHANGDARGTEADTSVVEALRLKQLKSLSTCESQFSQYESLVIQNLSEEIVEIFFNWRPTEKERVQEMVQALQLCQALDKTADLYQRRLQQTVRMTVRTTIAEFVESSGAAGSGGVTSMTYPSFYSCLQLLIEEIQSILQVGSRVDEFCLAEDIFGSSSTDEEKRWTEQAVSQGADLATKSIAELLRLRKESHALITQQEMKQLWDTCLAFNDAMEGFGSNSKAVNLRSTLVGQAKAWLDRTHESNMSSLVAALDSERWTSCEVSAERQAALTRLCTGLATVSAPVRSDGASGEKKPFAIVEGVQFKVVWSCLLLVEMVMTNLSAAAHFQSLAPNAVTKVVELLRLWNGRTTNLVLGAGAMKSAAKLKSINAKHLSYVTQCLGMMVALLPHIYAALMAQLPAKQHALLSEIDKIKKEYQDHSEKVLNKFVSIIGGIVEQALAPKIAGTNFASRDRDFPVSDGEDIRCCVFLDGISANTKKLHQVLSALLPPDHLQDVFSRIFAYLDEKIPAIFVAATATQSNGFASFQLPSTDDGKRRMILEVLHTTKTLNGLSGVHPWDFTAVNVLERKLDYTLPVTVEPTPVVEAETPPQNDNGGETEAQEPVAESFVPASDDTTLPTQDENTKIKDEKATEEIGGAMEEPTQPLEKQTENAIPSVLAVETNGESSVSPEESELPKPVENGNGAEA